MAEGLENQNVVDSVAVTSPTLAKVASTGGLDLNAIRVDQSALSLGSLKPESSTIPVEKPGRQEWVNIPKDPQYRITANVFFREEGTSRECYLVYPDIAARLDPQVCRPTLLIMYMTRLGQVKIWPIKLPVQFGSNEWTESALAITSTHLDQWVSVRSNISIGAYESVPLKIPLDNPVLPEKTLSELLEVAFRGRIIQTEDHHIIREYQGHV